MFIHFWGYLNTVTSHYHPPFALEISAEHCEYPKYSPRARILCWKSATHGANARKGVFNHTFRNWVKPWPCCSEQRLLSLLSGVRLSDGSRIHHKACAEAVLGVSTRTITIQSQTPWCFSDEIPIKRKVHPWKGRKKKGESKGPQTAAGHCTSHSFEQESVKLQDSVVRRRSALQQFA